jgi:hypothetical protein
MIFSTVKTLIETVGRTRASNWGELDKLTCLWTGPTAKVNSVGMGATHPQYGNMEVNAIRKIADVAGVTRLELDYVGLFDGGRRGPIVVEQNASESEIEYQEPYSAEVGYNVVSSTDSQGNVTDTITVTWRLWALSTIIRYLSHNVVFSYVAYRPNEPIGGSPGPGVSLISVRPGGTAQSTLVSQTYTVGPGSSGSISGSPDMQQYLGTGPWGNHIETYCSSFETRAMSPNWYKCRETWTARYFAG